MRVVSLLAFKGGSGKTTLSLNLAAAWSARRTVALIDLDPQGNATHSLSAMTKPGTMTAADVLHQAMRDPRFTVPPEAWSAVEFDDGSGFYLLPTPDADALSVAAEMLAVRPDGGVSALKRALTGVAGLEAAVIDTAPSISRLTMNAVAAADAVVGVVTPQRWSVEGALAAEAYVADARDYNITEAQFVGAILNRVKGRKTVVSEAMRKAIKASGIRTFDTVVPERVAIEEAEYLGVPVVIGDPKSASAKALEEVGKEVWRVTGPAAVKKTSKKKKGGKS